MHAANGFNLVSTGFGGELCYAMIIQGVKEIMLTILEAFHVCRKIRGFAMKA